MNSSWFKNALFALSILPLLAKFPYMVNAWQHAPLERGSWLLWICALASIILCEAARRNYSPASPKTKGSPLFFIPALVVCGIGWFFFGYTRFHVHTFSIFLGIAFLYLSAGWRWGPHLLVAHLPSLLFALLATPSVAYWSGYYLGLNLSGALQYLLVKMAVGWVVLGGWILFVVKTKTYPRLQSLCFCLAVVLLLLYSSVRNTSLADGAPLKLNTQELQLGEWTAYVDKVTAADTNFFTGCTWIGRFRYFNNRSYLTVLALEVADITNLHPMPICLKSGGAHILSNQQIYLQIHGKEVQVNELEVDQEGVQSLAYSFYSNDSASTGNFTKFRLLRKDHKIWYHYQIMTPNQPNKEAARARVESFLNTFALDEKPASQISAVQTP